MLFLLACTGADTGVDIDFVGPSPVVGGDIIAWGADGAYLLRDDDFQDLSRQRPVSVNATTGEITLLFGLQATSFLDGVPAGSVDIPCREGESALDALSIGGVLWAICAAEGSPGYLASGPRPGTAADRLQADQGTLYFVEDLGREGTRLTPLDGVAKEMGFVGEARGGSFFATAGEVGNDPHGEIHVGHWDDGPPTPIALADGSFAAQLDVLDGHLILARLLGDPRGDDLAVLLNHDGVPLGVQGPCISPRLVWQEDSVDAWCASPLERQTWRWDNGVFTETARQRFDLDVDHLLVVEPGD
jgi:hypothetical protein